MKLLLKILLIASILGSAVVGLLIMDHKEGNCLASYLTGTVCNQLNALAYIGLHVNFLKNFSNIVLTMFYFLLLSVIFFIHFVFYLDNFNLDKKSYKKYFIRAVSYKKQEQVNWLSLFENSPTAIKRKI